MASTSFTAKHLSGSAVAAATLMTPPQSPWSTWATLWSAGPQRMRTTMPQSPTWLSCTLSALPAKRPPAAIRMGRGAGSPLCTWELCSTWTKETDWRQWWSRICCNTWRMSRGRLSLVCLPCEDRWLRATCEDMNVCEEKPQGFMVAPLWNLQPAAPQKVHTALNCQCNFQYKLYTKTSNDKSFEVFK